uniref:Uncharacterized protein n=1 Tax=Anopheles minimus TaxID=112268 RepID=A0A182W6C8_9DIPT
MKKSTRLTLCVCLILVAITAPSAVLSDEAEEQEQQDNQEAVAPEGEDTQAPADETDANEGEATDTEQQEQPDGTEPRQEGLLELPAGIGVAMGTVGWICMIALVVSYVGADDFYDEGSASFPTTTISPQMIIQSRALFEVPRICPDGLVLDHKGICRRMMG